MITVSVNPKHTIKPIKPMHAAGQPPFGGGFLKFDFSYIRHLKNAKMPYARLHDVNGAFGGNRFVDVPNIFRDFDADENDPASYDFAFTDALLAAMQEYDIKPIYRLGVTIENQANFRSYRIDPPKDFHKWARVCEHIIRHYNEGWANGFHYGIEYWEIWNEPENGATVETNQMWTGTAQQFYELYDVTAKHLKKCFGDTVKVGGYGSCGFYGVYYHPEKYGVSVPQREKDHRYDKDVYRVEFFLGFMEYIREKGSPIDFFTWHSYSDVEKTLVMDEFLHKTLKEYGYEGLETHLNEWNNAHEGRLHGTGYAAAAAAGMMLAFQNAHTDMLCYYDTRLQASTYGGFFAPLTYEPVATYYAFAAFGRLYQLGTQAEAVVTGAEGEFYALCATDGKKNALMLVNRTGEKQDLALKGVDMDHAQIHLIDTGRLLSMAFEADAIANDTILLIEW